MYAQSGSFLPQRWGQSSRRETPRQLTCLILLLLIAMVLVSSYQPANLSQNQQPLATAARPVTQLPSAAPSAANIDFDRFEFARLALGHGGALPSNIEGAPSKRVQYFVEPTIYGVEAIATAKFEVLDEQGAVIGPIPILQQNEASGSSWFYGMMVVPDKPFRVAVSGEAVDGQQYRRILPRLFRPNDRPESWDSLISPGLPKAQKQKRIAAAKEFMRQQSAKVKEEFEKLPGGVIMMPRTRVFNVTYAPLLSPSGRPRGFRITYDVEFSASGYYNPELQVFPFYENEDWRGRVEMRVLDGNIEPQPTEAGSPQVQPNLLAYGAGYIYRGQTVYRFTADLLPDYVMQNEAKTKFCLYKQKFNNSPPHVRAAWIALLSSKEPTTYRVSIQNSDFEGVIEKSYTVREIYEGFAAEGAGDCGVQPNSRF